MKLKTKSGAKKRVKISGGKTKRMFVSRSCKQHRLHQKSKRAKHLLRKGARMEVTPTLRKQMEKMLPGLL